MNDLRIIAITHKHFPLETIGQFHIEPERHQEVLSNIRETAGMGELMFISTCNRVEIIFTLPHFVCPGQTAKIIRMIQPTWSDEQIKATANLCERYNGKESVEHLLRVASSLESVILGEREIITQLRKSFEESQAIGLSGDSLRLVIQQCIRTAKEIFTHTDLAKKPVSAVSLAWQEFLKSGIHKHDRILLIGAGQIIRNFTKFLHEHGYHNLTIANRTIEKAISLAGEHGKGIHLEQLPLHTEGFDALITCTASEHALIDPALYTSLLAGETGQKLVIDLALPSDLNQSVLSEHPIKYIGMETIQTLAGENMAFRQQALSDCEVIIENGKREFEKLAQQRQIELAMQAIPDAVKEIRNTALGSVFAKELEHLDTESREVIEKIMNYMEKKYISIPMKMAREVLLNEAIKN